MADLEPASRPRVVSRRVGPLEKRGTPPIALKPSQGHMSPARHPPCPDALCGKCPRGSATGSHEGNPLTRSSFGSPIPISVTCEGSPYLDARFLRIPLNLIIEPDTKVPRKRTATGRSANDLGLGTDGTQLAVKKSLFLAPLHFTGGGVFGNSYTASSDQTDTGTVPPTPRPAPAVPSSLE